MPFGKWRGYFLREIPDDYLDWLLGIELKSYLRRAVELELGRRSGGGDGGDDEDGEECEGYVVPSVSVVDRWYRRAAVRFHPDGGGLSRDMVVVNACRELLLEVLSESD